jgi:hypothetical protein
METQNTEFGYSSSEDSVASTSSLGSIRSVGSDGIINQLNITSRVEVNPLKSLNKELLDKMELLENQNIPELLQNLLFVKDKLPLINDQLEFKYLDKERKLKNAFIKKELEVKKQLSNIISREKNLNNLLEQYKLRNDEDEIVELNIGGIIYTTKKSTLCSYKTSYFYYLFSEKGNMVKDKNGKIFIDRDGTTFKYLLNWLRDSSIEDFPKKDSDNYILFLSDLKYYGYHELERIVLFDSDFYHKGNYIVYKNENNQNIICRYLDCNPKKYTYSIFYWDNKEKVIVNAYANELKIQSDLNFYYNSKTNNGTFYYYDKSDKEIIDKLEIQCPICFDNIKEEELICKTPCNHIYHKKCISKWLQQNKKTCPKCRSNLIISSIELIINL